MDGPSVAFLLEFGVFFSLPILFAVWQLRSLKKLDEADAKKEQEASERDSQS